MTVPARLFGTDGIRGPAGEPPLDGRSLRRLGRALGRLLGADGSPPTALLGGDTRSSTAEISASLADGLRSAGCRVRYGGVLPTPAVARLTEATGAAVGIAVSASHNPFPDNGVKLLDREGYKWARALELELERAYADQAEPHDDAAAPLDEDGGLRELYLDRLLALFPERPLAGSTVVLDTANGAATELAPRFIEALGAAVETLGDRPDGTNINRNVGSTYPQPAARMVVENRAGLGFAFDGDADRVMMIDETGAVHDGDAMLYLLATTLKGRGELEPPRIVATSMSNLGLETALASSGLDLVRCDVGDRTVVETLRERGLVLGGEQSGHIVHLGQSSTGDGLLTAARIAETVVASGRPASRCVAEFSRFPQILHNIRVSRKPSFDELPEVREEARRVTEHLGQEGRLVLRYSGTEPLARVMIEGRDQQEIEELAASLGAAIQDAIGAERT